MRRDPGAPCRALLGDRSHNGEQTRRKSNGVPRSPLASLCREDAEVVQHAAMSLNPPIDSALKIIKNLKKYRNK